MQISLTQRLEAFIQEKVESGLYRDESEVISEALRLLYQDDQLHQIKLERLREAVRLGDEQALHGDFSSRTIDDIIADNEYAVRKVHG